jgi:hypothetical protein
VLFNALLAVAAFLLGLRLGLAVGARNERKRALRRQEEGRSARGA